MEIRNFKELVIIVLVTVDYWVSVIVKYMIANIYGFKYD